MKEKKKQDCEVSYKNVCPISQKESEIKGFVNSAKCAIRCQIKLTIDEYIGNQTKNEKNLEAIMEKDEYKEHPLFGNPRSEEDHTHHYLG